MINDSAGIEVNLIDKSERTSTTIGFRSAAAVEAVRGLCETPTLITSEDDYVKVFGTPTLDKTGAASMEAYLLAQRRVPQVLTRAKNPSMDANARPFATAIFESTGGALDVNSKQASNFIEAPAADNLSYLYFKGEGTYPCGELPDANGANKSNIVLRFSKPVEESAYANADRVVHLQVFDFAGTSHIDEDRIGKLVFNPTLGDVLDVNGSFTLSDILGVAGTAHVAQYTVTAYVNGRPGVETLDSGSGSGMGQSANLWDAINSALKKAKTAAGESILDDSNYLFKVDPAVTGNDSDHYIETIAGAINAFKLSVSLAIEAEINFTADELIQNAYVDVESGTLIVKHTEEGATVRAVLSASATLIDRSKYMFMGAANADWAALYNAYLKEAFDFSFSYDDYDANYVSLQADAVLKSSNYLVCKSSDNFADYAIDWEHDEFVNKLMYFGGTDVVDSNAINAASKSYAYSKALGDLLASNLVMWRCACAPNLGDVMIKGDYVSAIEAASETSLGVSNIGRAASVDVMNNLTGCHGNRFIADYSVYGYRSLNGRRTPVTMACLMTDRLNTNFNNGNEARPPFGYTYGQIACNEISQLLTGPQRQMLARQYKVNPVIEDGGYFAWDERTSQLKDTSLSDIHNILSFIWMKYQIYDSMKSFIAEYNDQGTVNRGLSILRDLCISWTSKNYVEEAQANADKNVIGDETMRFSVAVRFKGAARYIIVDVTAYSQTQSLDISLAQEV